MRFEWDETKNRLNIAKHGASFEIARMALLSPLRRSIDIQWVNGEERVVVVAETPHALLLAVVVVERLVDETEVIRIVSARKATPDERRRYREDS